MPAYTTILTALAPVFLVMAAGAAVQRSGIVTDEIETGVMRLVLVLLAPCLIFNKIAGNPELERLDVALWSIGSGLVLILTGYVIAFVAAKAARLKKGHGLRTFTITAGIQNYGFMALPVVMELWPEQTGPAGLIFVHGLGVEIALWTAGMLIITGHTAPSWRMLVNGPFLAVIVSLTLNYTGAHIIVPEVVRRAMAMLGDCAIPMSLFMIGATIGRLFERQFLGEMLRIAPVSIAVRIVLIPAVILCAAKFLPMPVELRKVLVVQAGMPSAVFPIVMARLYGGHPPTAVQVVLATTLACVLTAPLVIALGMAWVPLD
ncbi:MAG: AEC family transporter [Akkermansiaceae bacterium]|nr:AEC family transporter [Akkermansiaceae bacterium]